MLNQESKGDGGQNSGDTAAALPADGFAVPAQCNWACHTFAPQVRAAAARLALSGRN